MSQFSGNAVIPRNKRGKQKKKKKPPGPEKQEKGGTLRGIRKQLQREAYRPSAKNGKGEKFHRR